MSTPKRKREVQVNFRVSPEELALIEQKMSQLGTKNREAYLRKMALDGYVVQLDLPELKELVSLLRRSSNNLNQLTRRVHETGRVYDADLEDIAQRQEQLWEGKPDSFRASVLKGMMHFVELYHGEFSEERLLRALRNIHPVDIYRIGQDDPAKLRGWKKYVFPIYTAYNGKCRKDALPMKF